MQKAACCWVGVRAEPEHKPAEAQRGVSGLSNQYKMSEEAY